MFKKKKKEAEEVPAIKKIVEEIYRKPDDQDPFSLAFPQGTPVEEPTHKRVEYRLLGEKQWYTKQPLAKNQFTPRLSFTTSEWNMTLVNEIYAAIGMIVKQLIEDANPGRDRIKLNDFDVKILVSPDLIDLIYTPDVFDSIIDMGEIIVTRSVGIKRIIIETDRFSSYYTVNDEKLASYKTRYDIKVVDDHAPNAN